MKDNFNYVSEDEIRKIHDDLIDVTGGYKGKDRDKNGLGYIVESSKHIDNPSLESISAYLLARIAKGHPFADGNKRTAYFSTRFFLMKNKADFNGRSIDEASSEVENIAKEPDINSAYKFAKTLCDKYIIKDKVLVLDYDDFYRMIIKSIGVAKKLSKM